MIIKNLFSIFIIIACIFSHSYVFGQSVGGSRMNNIYIPSGGFISIFNVHNFSTDSSKPDRIYTSRNSDPGIVNFADKGKWERGSDFSYVDGFVRVSHDRPFTFPVGDMGFYKPLSIEGGSGTTVAYYFNDVQQDVEIIQNLKLRNNSNLTNSYITPSINEYWKISGNKPTNFILHWDESSDLEYLADDLSDVYLIGWNGEHWERIETEILEYSYDLSNSELTFSTIKSSLKKGSLKTKQAIIPNQYSIITFGTNEVKNQIVSLDSKFRTSLLNKEKIELTIYPNPASNLNQVKVDYNLTNIDSDVYIVIFDNTGKLILKEQLDTKKGLYSVLKEHEMNHAYNIGIVTNNGSRNFESVIIGSR